MLLQSFAHRDFADSARVKSFALPITYMYTDTLQFKCIASDVVVNHPETSRILLEFGYVPVVSRITQWVSAHAYGCLNISHYFGLRGCLPGIKIPYICIEVARVAP